MIIDVHTGRGAESLLNNNEFRVEWRRLYDLSFWSTVFQHEDFVVTWYEVYRTQFSPVIVTGTDANGDLVGLFTLAIDDETGEIVAAGGRQAEYQAWLADPINGDQFIEAALDELKIKFPGKTLTLLFVHPDTPVSWAQDHSRWARNCHLKTLSRGLMTIGDGQGFKDALRKKQNKLNRLKRMGDFRFERITDTEELESIFDDVICYQNLRLMAIYNLTKPPQDPRKKQFYLEMLRIDGMLHVTAMRLGDKLISAQLHMFNKDQLLLGLITHSPIYSKHSPGTLHILMLGTELANLGVPVFDLTPGGEYKERYATHHDEVYVIKIFFSRARLLEYKSKRKLIDIGKTAIKTFNLTEMDELKAQLANLMCRREKWKSLGLAKTARAALGLPKRAIWDKQKSCVYSCDIENFRNSGNGHQIRIDHIPDLLLYKPTETWQLPVNIFFKKALEYFEGGAQFYTRTEGGKLVGYFWLIEGKNRNSLPGFESRDDIPDDALVVAEFFLSRDYLETDRSDSAVSQMLSAAAAASNSKEFYISVESDNSLLKDAIEKAGFVHKSISRGSPIPLLQIKEERPKS